MSTRPYPVLTARGAKETDNRPNEAFLGYYPKSFHIRKGFCIDHARDYTHYHPTDPMVLEDTSFAVYILRILAHFCALIFILLAGISARLSGSRKSPNQLSVFLLTRGLVLCLLEITLVN